MDASVVLLVCSCLVSKSSSDITSVGQCRFYPFGLRPARAVLSGLPAAEKPLKSTLGSIAKYEVQDPSLVMLKKSFPFHEIQKSKTPTNCRTNRQKTMSKPPLKNR